ncbi:MAG: hypothetical protein WCP09_02380 [Candidatus Taylorbacteria bacterium]
MEPQTSGVKTWQWVVTIIVIIALIVLGILVFGGKKSNAPVITDDTTSQIPTTALNRIVMSDQFPGNVVYLSSVQVQNSSWVVIQSDNGGQPGAIMGSAHYDAGINPGGKITLSTPTLDGGTYYAVIYTDDGSGKFNAVKDVPLKDSVGNIIMHIFHATTAASAGLKG